MNLDFTLEELLEISEALDQAESFDPELQANIESAREKINLALENERIQRQKLNANAEAKALGSGVPHEILKHKAATALEDGWGECPRGRAALLQWLDDQLPRHTAAGIKTGAAAAHALSMDYLAWIGDSAEESP